MAMMDVGSRIKSSATLIGEEEGAHDGDRDTLNTPSQTMPLSNDSEINARRMRIIPS